MADSNSKGFIGRIFNVDYTFCSSGIHASVPADIRKGINLGGAFYQLFRQTDDIALGFGLNMNVPIVFTGGSLSETPIVYSTLHAMAVLRYGNPETSPIGIVDAIRGGLTAYAKAGIDINGLTILFS